LTDTTDVPITKKITADRKKRNIFTFHLFGEKGLKDFEMLLI